MLERSLILSIPKHYSSQKIWLTIDIEEITDTNFYIRWKKNPDLDYEKLLSGWIELCESLGLSSTCFVLGNFAQKYPQVIKRLHEAGHEIASHGLTHELVNKMDFSKWQEELAESKSILESITGVKVEGYRSPSWSLPFEKRYYEGLFDLGFGYSSSYFPMKTYMYGNAIDKKHPFRVCGIMEIPLAKYVFPFSGGFYLRVLPSFIQVRLAMGLRKCNVKPVVYIHPYELIDQTMMRFFSRYAGLNLDYLLAFYEYGDSRKKIKAMVQAL